MEVADLDGRRLPFVPLFRPVQTSAELMLMIQAPT
jgi:hypothetical protein